MPKPSALILLSTWLLPAVAPAQTSTGTTATASTATTAEPEDGPQLEIDGIELVEEEPSPAKTKREEAPDAFAERTDPLATLADRAAGIIDRTTIGGYGEHDFEAGEGKVARFRNHRYVVFVYSQISERISTATEIEFEFAGSPRKGDGNLGIGEVLLEFSVVDLNLFDWLILRAGVILMPVGAFNLRHDSPTRDLTARPIAYTTIVPSTWFESGAGFYGTIPMGDTQRLTYEVYAVNGLDARIYDGFGLRAARGSHFEDNNHDKAIVGRIGYSPTLGFELGLSGYTGAYDKRKNRVNLANVDLTWRLGDFELLGEAVYAAIDEGFVEGFPAGSPANTRDAVPERMFGFYLQANYHFGFGPLVEHLPDWMAASTFTAVVRYEGKDTDLERGSAAGDQNRLTFGLNFRPVEPYVLKTDYQLQTAGTDGVEGAPHLFSPDFWDRLSFTFMASVAFLF